MARLPSDESKGPPPLFDGLRVYVADLQGHDRQLVHDVRDELRRGGAQLVSLPQATIVVASQKDVRSLPAAAQECEVVMPLWVLKRRQLAHLGPLPTFGFVLEPRLFLAGVCVCFTGVKGPRCKMLTALVQHYGGMCTRSCTPHVTHLVYGKPTNMAKYNYAKPRMTAMLCDAGAITPESLALGPGMWVVTVKWLEDCIRFKRLQPGTPYIVPTVGEDGDPGAVPVLKLSQAAPPRTFRQASGGPAPALDAIPEEGAIRGPSQRSSDSPDFDECVEVMAGYKLVLARHLTLEHTASLCTVIPRMKGAVVDSLPTVASSRLLFVAKYQLGRDFQMAMRLGVVAVSPEWVFACFDEQTLLPTCHSDSRGSTSLARRLTGIGSRVVVPCERHVLSAPVPSRTGVPGMQHCIIGVSGYPLAESTPPAYALAHQGDVPTRQQLMSVIDALGACYVGVFDRSWCTHLVCCDASTPKFTLARKHGIPVVSHHWLSDCLRVWKRLREAKYVFPGPAPASVENWSWFPRVEEVALPTPTTPPAFSVAGRASPPAFDDVPPGDGTPSQSQQSPASVRAATPDASGGAGDAPGAAAGSDVPAKPTAAPSRAEAQRLPHTPPADTPRRAASDRSSHGAGGGGSESAGCGSGAGAGSCSAVHPFFAAGGAASIPVPTFSLGSALAVLQRSRSAPLAAAAHAPPPAHLDPSPLCRSRSTGASAAQPLTGKVRSEVGPQVADSATPAPTVAAPPPAPQRLTPQGGAGARERVLATRAPERSPVVLITGGDKARQQAIVRSLGGTVCGKGFNMKATLVVASSLGRTEKLLCACAAGKLIVRPSYLTASAKAGKFVNPESFEWGFSALGAKRLRTPRGRAASGGRKLLWAGAPAKWRRHGGGVFRSHTVFICDGITPPPGLCLSVISAGGGTAVLPPFEDRGVAAAVAGCRGGSHVYALVPDDPSTPRSLCEVFLRHRIPCLRGSWVVDYLGSETPLVQADYQVRDHETACAAEPIPGAGCGCARVEPPAPASRKQLHQAAHADASKSDPHSARRTPSRPKARKRSRRLDVDSCQ